MSTLILLGAGASFGSEEVVPHPPPLGSGREGLFAHLEKFSPHAAGLPKALREAFRENFEEGMAQYEVFTERSIMQMQRDIARYFAQFEPGARNEYRTVLRKIGPRATWSTLNYDLLLEISAAQLGYGIHYGTAQTSGCICVLKPHGSCNVWPKFGTNIIRGPVIMKNNRGGDLRAPIRPLGLDETRKRCEEEANFAPALAAFAVGKRFNVSSPFMDKMQEDFRLAITGASQIFVSGVAIQPLDRHIWEEIAKSTAALTYFGRPSSETAFSRWRESAQAQR